MSLSKLGSGRLPASLWSTVLHQSMELSKLRSSRVRYGLTGNIFADSFDSLTGVDVAGATQLDTATAGLLKPVVTADTFGTTLDPTLNADATAQGGICFRQVIAAAAFSTNGDQVRLTLKPDGSTTTTIQAMYIGNKGAAAPNFDGGQVRVTFNGGQNTCLLTAGGASVVSDPIPFAFDKTKDFVIAWENSAVGGRRQNTAAGANFTVHYKTSTTGESDDTTVSSYATIANCVSLIDLMEVRTATGAAQNVIVRTQNIPLTTSPTVVRGALLVQEIDAAVAGTDYTFEASRDDGVNYGAFTLTERFTTPDGYRFVTAESPAAGFLTGAGLTGRLRFKSLNNKNVALAAWAAEFHPA